MFSSSSQDPANVQSTLTSILPKSRDNLVLAGSCLASFQLLQIPAADLHVTLILVQTLGELLSIPFTAPSTPVVALVGGGRRRVGGRSVRLLRLSRGAAGAATEESTDGMSY